MEQEFKHPINGGSTDTPLRGYRESSEIINKIQGKIDETRRSTQALELMLSEVQDLRLPRTMQDHFSCNSVNHISTKWWCIRFTAREGVDPTLAFGTIIKVADAFQEAGWGINEGFNLKPDDYRKKMAAEIVAQKPIDGISYRLDFDFDGLPEGPYCRLVEEDVVIPATPERIEKKLRVVCEEQERLPQPSIETHD